MSQPNVAYTHSNFIQKLKLKPSSSSSYPAPSSKQCWFLRQRKRRRTQLAPPVLKFLWLHLYL
ncbi:hypothetical protein CsSME_00032575 [Camellia sinensis var. sinensis]